MDGRMVEYHSHHPTDIFTTFISHQLSSVWQTPAASLALCGTHMQPHNTRTKGRRFGDVWLILLEFHRKTLTPCHYITTTKNVNLLHFWNFTTIKKWIRAGKIKLRMKLRNVVETVGFQDVTVSFFPILFHYNVEYNFLELLMVYWRCMRVLWYLSSCFRTFFNNFSEGHLPGRESLFIKLISHQQA